MCGVARHARACYGVRLWRVSRQQDARGLNDAARVEVFQVDHAVVARGRGGRAARHRRRDAEGDARRGTSGEGREARQHDGLLLRGRSCTTREETHVRVPRQRRYNCNVSPPKRLRPLATLRTNFCPQPPIRLRGHRPRLEGHSFCRTRRRPSCCRAVRYSLKQRDEASLARAVRTPMGAMGTGGNGSGPPEANQFKIWFFGVGLAWDLAASTI